MKLYSVVYATGEKREDGELEEFRAWAGTQVAAKKLQKGLEATHGRSNVDDFEPIDVPTSKEKLLEFLNAYAK